MPCDWQGSGADRDLASGLCGMVGAKAMPFLNSVEVEVLRLLMGSSGYLSEAEISRVLGISRGDVVGALERLVSLGYRIEAVPGRGFRFISVDDLSTVGERLAGLGTRLGFAVHYLEECSSTQDVAESLVLRGAPEGTVVIAGRLASGRGRMGRRWYAPEGGIWMTLVLRPKSVRVLQLMSLAMGVAVAEAIRSVLDVDARVKWPNDVLVEEKKVAGILIECRVEAGSVHRRARRHRYKREQRDPRGSKGYRYIPERGRWGPHPEACDTGGAAQEHRQGLRHAGRGYA